MVPCIIDEIDGVAYMYFKTEMFIAVLSKAFTTCLEAIVCTVKSAVKQMEYSNPIRFLCMGQWELSHSYV